MLRVVKPGPRTLVQDDGRPGHADQGVTDSGAFDRGALHAAREAVGGPPDAAVLEVTMGGLRLEADADHVLAVAGAPCRVDVDGEEVPHGRPFVVRAGSVVRLGRPSAGLRSYLAVAGGIAVDPVLGSRSSDTLSGLGPAPLTAGDVLPVGPLDTLGERPLDKLGERGTLGERPLDKLGERGTASDPTRPHPLAEPVEASPLDTLGERGALGDRGALGERSEGNVIPVVLGPRDDWFTAEARAAFLSAAWTVSPRSDRVGVRLDGPVLARERSGELASEPCVRGSVQVTSAGLPVVLGPDHPVTGGYPVIAVVTDVGLDRLAQARPGSRLRFASVDAPR